MKRIIIFTIGFFLLISSIVFSQDFPTRAEVYDYDIADVFHRVNTTSEGEYGEWYYTDSVIRIMEVIDKAYTQNNDSICYVFFIKKHEIYESYPHNNYSEDTMTSYITNLDDLVEGDTVVEDPELFNGRKIVRYNWANIEGPEESHYSKRWVVGCGRTTNTTSHFSWATLMNVLYTNELVYYKKGDEEWGEEQVIVGIADIEKVNGILIYPNPALEMINIQSNENAIIQIYHSTGQLQLSKEVSPSDSQIDISQFPAGVYFVNILDENGLIIGKSKFLKL